MRSIFVIVISVLLGVFVVNAATPKGNITPYDRILETQLQVILLRAEENAHYKNLMKMLCVTAYERSAQMTDSQISECKKVGRPVGWTE